MAAGKKVFYTDLPDTDACILLFGLFFNLKPIVCVRPTCLRPAWARLLRVVRGTQNRIALIFALKYGLFPHVTVDLIFILFVTF